jgi:hypothetical protein
MPSCETGAFMKHFIGVAVIVALALVVRFLLFQRFALGFYRHASTFQVIPVRIIGFWLLMGVAAVWFVVAAYKFVRS